MPSIKLQRLISRDQHNALRSHTVAIIDGKAHRPSIVACVWRNRTWKDGATLFSRMESVMRVGDTLYRMGERSAKPLRLEPGEHVFPCDHPVYNSRISVTEQRPA